MSGNLRLLAFLLALLTFCSCEDAFIVKTHGVCDLGERLAAERRLLTDEEELDAIARSRSDAVDWRLAEEFAWLWLDRAIRSGEYPKGSLLMDLPIPIYSADGNPVLYEFRVVCSGESIAHITAAATKEYCCPILYDSMSSGYYDGSAMAFLDSISQDCQGIRMVDNGYPNVAYGCFESADDSARLRFGSFFDTGTHRKIVKEQLRHVVSYCEFAEDNPGLALKDADMLKAKSAIDTQRDEAARFWSEAEKSRGSIASKAHLYGKSDSSVRTSLDKSCIYDAFHINGGFWHVANYGACGAVSAGFVLDYLQANRSVHSSWKRLEEFEDKKEGLYKTMFIGYTYLGELIDAMGENGDVVTLPTDIGNAISYFSDYRLSLSLYSYPKISVNSNLPGISLRTLSSGGMHYRNVIAYRQMGWGPFCWPEFKILDLVDSSDLREGSWETFIPAYHIANWNVVRK
ncbi:MAG TPA: hypothetical protein DCO86_03740 [Spirochaetaceae bacterium]|nr:hypothetical protein [Spirochaetaceae bacterium]